ncbi:FtsX-like permease family protein [Caldanaerobacter subterraneus]|uniref:FtsX-like permease family protein n=2 Tax=Caldanaerobacter subterraneus TaxID=911092 RepID=A0A4R2JLK0_9THEO|nr:FtsX-like permease family protein [Caldanaerobacter subterraneus]
MQRLTEVVSIKAREDLQHHWRWQYDILVYPKESQTYQALGDGWVAPQTPLSSYGGISFEDLETIRSIPGVEVAAPISILGYFKYAPIPVSYEDAQKGKIYEVKYQMKAFDGLKKVLLKNYLGYDQYESMEGVKDSREILSNIKTIMKDYIIFWNTFVPPSMEFRIDNELLLVAVDPESEDKLYNLSQTVVEGDDLRFADLKIEKGIDEPVLPILILKDQGLDVEESIQVSEVSVPNDVNLWDMGADAIDYLKKSPKKIVASYKLNAYSPEWRYKLANIELKSDKVEVKPYIMGYFWDLFRYSPLHFKFLGYEENGIPLLYVEGHPREKNPLFGNADETQVYREILKKDEKIAFSVDVVGVYDAHKIKPNYASSWKPGDPVDIYTPHHSMIIADGEGNPVKPRPQIPLPMKDSYYTGGPEAITVLTKDVAKLFYKDNPPISAVRVVVKGVEERSPISQKKIEQIAKEIMDKTGHKVEIMLGASPTKVHVKLGGAQKDDIGMVEEGWIKEGVSWAIEEKVSNANKWLFIYLLVIIFFLLYTVITHSLINRSVEFAQLRTIGWSRKRIIYGLSLEVISLTIFSLIPVLFFKASYGSFTWKDIAFIGTLNGAIIATGYFSGSYRSLLLSPRMGLSGEGTSDGRRLISVRGFFTFIFHQMMRGPLRFGLLVLSVLLSTLMVILFVSTQYSLSEFLYLSFLGEAIDLHLLPYQKALLGLGVGLTIAVVVVLLWLNLWERQEEFGLLWAIGWPRRRLMLYNLIEAGTIGSLGGILGSLSALIILKLFSTLWLPPWVVVVAVLLPMALMMAVTAIVMHFIKLASGIKRGGK